MHHLMHATKHTRAAAELLEYLIGTTFELSKYSKDMIRCFGGPFGPFLKDDNDYISNKRCSVRKLSAKN